MADHAHIYRVKDDPEVEVCLNIRTACDARHRPRPAPSAPVMAQESSDTSRAAARRVSGRRVRDLERAAWRLYVAAGPAGLTDDELLVAMQRDEPAIRDNSTRPRRINLEKKRNLLVPAGKRPTRTGSPAVVYRVRELNPISLP